MEIIEIKNNLSRPVIFRVPGSSIRLSPGGSAPLPAAYAEMPEIQQLRRKQAISLNRKAEPKVSQNTKPAKKKSRRKKK